MAAESPNSATVGQINVAVGADLSGLQSKLAQAEAATKASAAKMAATMAAPVGDKSAAFRAAMGGGAGFGMGKGPGVSGIGGGGPIDTAAASAAGERTGKSWLDGFKKGSRDLRLILGGFGLVGAVAAATRLFELGRKIGDAFFNADSRARAFADTLNGLRVDRIEATVAAVVKLREALGHIGSAEAERVRTLALIRAEEAKINAEFAKQIEHFDTLSGLWEGLTRRMNRGELTAEAERKRVEAIKEATRELTKQAELRIKIMEAAAEQERIERRMREQAKRDITHTTIDARRIGPALDLLQRQRTAG